MNATNGGGDPKTIRSLETSFTIIEYLVENESAGITELAGAVNVSKSTVHNHLKTLENMEYIVQEGDEYALGYRFLSLGVNVRSRSQLYELGKPEIDWLVEETNEKACVATEENGEVVYLYQSRHESAAATDSRTGSRMPMHCTGLGKAILANLPRSRVQEIIDRHGTPQFTPNTITSSEELFDELDVIRDRGFAFDDEERLKGFRCVAVPIMKDDEVYGAISVAGPMKNLQGEWFHEELPELVQRSTEVVEMNLTYS